MTTQNQGRDRPSDGVTWTETVCTFHRGDTRHLLAETLSPEEIFVITMLPPALREIVKIDFLENRTNSPRRVEALVVETVYRPRDIMRCGFMALVTDETDLFSYPPTSPLKSVNVSFTAMKSDEHVEKRRDPRIRVEVDATVRIPGRSLPARILNLSMSGALMGFTPEVIPPEMEIGTLCKIEVYDEHRALALCAKADIIRLIGVGKPTNAGVRFIDLCDDTRSKIEHLILGAIRQQAAQAGRL